MAYKYKDFKDFRGFVGKVNGDTYKFPPLYSLDSHNNTRVWQIIIKLVESDAQNYDYQHDWEDGDYKTFPILDEYYEMTQADMTEDIIAMIYVIQGIKGGKISRYRPAFVVSGRAQGRSNARNVFTQALIDARSQYDKKISSGYQTSAKIDITNAKYFAMAAKVYDDYRDRISYPLYSQPKLDGVRCISALDGNRIIKYSRDLNEWIGYDYFDDVLMPLFRKYPNLHIDGELYKHGKHLQEITGVARSEEKKFTLRYYIFDCFVPSKPSLKFSERQEILDELEYNKYVVRVPTILLENERECDRAYKKYLQDSYEGQMIRVDAPYAISQHKEKRSEFLLKRKKKYDAEYKLVDVECGTRGAAIGAFIGVFITANGYKFKASPKDMSFAKMRELYQDSLDGKFIGKMATIQYDDLSKDGVPLRPKFLAFREHK